MTQGRSHFIDAVERACSADEMFYIKINPEAKRLLKMFAIDKKVSYKEILRDWIYALIEIEAEETEDAVLAEKANAFLMKLKGERQ